MNSRAFALHTCEFTTRMVVFAPTSTSNPLTGAWLNRITTSCASGMRLEININKAFKLRNIQFRRNCFFFVRENRMTWAQGNARKSFDNNKIPFRIGASRMMHRSAIVTTGVRYAMVMHRNLNCGFSAGQFLFHCQYGMHSPIRLFDC